MTDKVISITEVVNLNEEPVDDYTVVYIGEFSHIGTSLGVFEKYIPQKVTKDNFEELVKHDGFISVQEYTKRIKGVKT